MTATAMPKGKRRIAEISVGDIVVAPEVASDKPKPTEADWRNAIADLPPEGVEFLHRPLVEDIWLSAMGHFPDTKPLADRLRTTPMTLAAQDLLAEYLSPSGPDINGRLVYESSDAMQQIVGSERDGDAGLLSLVVDYHDEVDRRRRTGEKDASQGAAVSVGQKTSQSDSSVYRKIRIWRGMAKSIVAHFPRSPK